MALTFSPRFDLRHTYFMVAGIAGIDPQQGTVGSAAWAKYLVDFGIQWEIDGREIPSGWNTGYLGINTTSPADKPPLDYRTEVFQLNTRLADTAFALSRNVALSDNAQAQAARAKYSYAPANRPPTVIQCDTLAGDTWWSGTLLGQRARDWTKILTDGKGVYCTTQQEDNATYEALKRAASVHKVDLNRVAVLRAGSDFDRPYDGQTSADNLLNYAAQGGFTIAIENLFRAGNPLVQDIVDALGRVARGRAASAKQRAIAAVQDNECARTKTCGHMYNNSIIPRLVLRRAVRRPHRGIGIPMIQFGWRHDVLLFEECMTGAAMIISFGNRIIAASSLY